MQSVQNIICFVKDVDSQPTIKVGVFGTINVYMRDGRIIKDLEVYWEYSPCIRIENGIYKRGDWSNPELIKVDLTNDEVEEIEKIMNGTAINGSAREDGLWRIAEQFVKIIDTLECCGTIKLEDYDWIEKIKGIPKK